jgi:hypothetical protein
MVQQAQPAQTE